MAKWQFRKYYGPVSDGELKDGWTEWELLVEGVEPYSPRTLLSDLKEHGKIEFRQILEDELMDVEDESEDLWPDFHDEALL